MARGAACALVLCIGNAVAWAADFSVAPGQSIQAAIQQAATGDRILLQPGTYFEAIDLLGKGIEVIGAGAASTVLDASGLGTSAIRSEKRGFVPYTRIRSLTLRGGSGSVLDGEFGGGGIHSNCANFDVLDCVIESNQAPNGRGGGLYLRSFSKVANCVIRHNSGAYGGGIAGNTDVTISNSTIESNQATFDGGGLFGQCFVDHCLFRDNDALRGGGVYIQPNTKIIRSCVFEANRAISQGGGLFHSTAGAWIFIPSGRVEACSFRGNSAPEGGGLYMTQNNLSDGIGSMVVADCSFAGNTAGSGDGVHFEQVGGAFRFVLNSTFLGDSVAKVDWIRNSIFRGAFVPFGTPGPFGPQVDYCNIEGGWPGEGNIDIDPQFVNVAADDLHLKATSPCRDSGSPNLSQLGTTDFDDEPRQQGGRVDIGADEFAHDCSGDGVPDFVEIAMGSAADCNHDGIADGCQSLPDCDGDGVSDLCEIAAGAPDCDGNGIPDSCDSFADCNGNGISDACDIASGFATDCNGNQLPDSCESLADCNGNGIADACDIASGFAIDCNGNGVPDSCDLASGTSVDLDRNGIPDECHGVLIVPSIAFPTIQKAIDAAHDDDTILVEDGTYSGSGNVNLDFKGKRIQLRSRNGPRHCILDGSDVAPLAVFNSSAEGEDTILRGFTLRNGRANLGGAIRVASSAAPTIRDCIFVDNSAITVGGAIRVDSAGHPIVSNCVFIDNQAQLAGGAIDCQATIRLVRCTFVGNTLLSANGNGGALRVGVSAHVEVEDSILWGEWTGSDRGQTGRRALGHIPRVHAV